MQDIKWFMKYDKNFRYMFLSRLIEDCKYYIGWGFRNPKILGGGRVSVKEHIRLMRALWITFIDKPVWCTKEYINELEEKMLNDNLEPIL